MANTASGIRTLLKIYDASDDSLNSNFLSIIIASPAKIIAAKVIRKTLFIPEKLFQVVVAKTRPAINTKNIPRPKRRFELSLISRGFFAIFLFCILFILFVLFILFELFIAF